MEHNAIQWLGAPSCQRGSYSFYKAVGSRSQPDAPLQTWRLGEFYYIRCSPEDPVCLAEVTLLWEDQTQRHLLASARLYFLPEDTPNGRTRDHGEDEVLAVSRKMVVKVEDLVKWSCSEGAGWKIKTKPGLNGLNGLNGVHTTLQNEHEIIQDEPKSPENETKPEPKPHHEEEEEATEEVKELKEEEEELKEDEEELKEEGEELKEKGEGLNDEGEHLKEQEEIQEDGEELKKEGEELKEKGEELKEEEKELKKEEEKKEVKEESEDLNDKMEDDAPYRQLVRVLSYPQYCRYRSLQTRTQGGAALPGLQDTYLLALGGLKVALSNTRIMYCRDTFNHPTLETNNSFSWQFRCPSLSLRGRPRKRKGSDGKESPTSGQSDSWIARMKENVMGSVEAGFEGPWLPHPDEQQFLDHLFRFMNKQGSPIHKVPNLGFKKIDLFLMYSVVKRLGGYEKVTNDRLWKIVYNELGGCPGSTSAATCTRRHYERLMLPYEEYLRDGGIEIRIPEFHLPACPKGMRGRKPGRKPGPKPKDKKIPTPSAPRTIINPDGTVVVKRGRGRPPGKRNKATLIAQAKLLAQQQARLKAVSGENTRPGRGRPPAHSANHRVPPLHTPTPIKPTVINMPLTPELSPMSGPFLPFQPKPVDLKPESLTNNTSLPSSASVPTQPLLLSALPRHFVSGFSPIKGICPMDVFRNRIQRGLENPSQDPSQQQQQIPIVYAIQPKNIIEALPQSQVPPPNRDGANQDIRNRLPLPPLRVLPLDLDCSVQVRQLMRTRIGSTQFQSFTRRLSEALSQDSAKPPCSPITPPPEQNLPLNLSKRLPPKRPHPNEINGQETDAKRLCEQGNFNSRLGQVGGIGQDLRIQEEPADLSSPSRIRAFLLGLPPFQVKLEEDLNGTRFAKLGQEQRHADFGLGPDFRRLEPVEVANGKQEDEVIIVEDDRDEEVFFVKEELTGNEAKQDGTQDEQGLKPTPSLVLAQHS